MTMMRVLARDLYHLAGLRSAVVAVVMIENRVGAISLCVKMQNSTGFERLGRVILRLEDVGCGRVYV